jgi:2',3'-cyclic-nucleotide 2'-phosphodiesterase (5'-nucleotidase family)
MLLAALVVAGLAASADSTLLRILTINDFHGALEPRVHGWSNRRRVGGAAALKATLDSAAVRCGCAVLRLDGGDEMQGSLASNLTHGRSTIEAFNRFGLDAAVIGNHELDWGVDTLRARMAESGYPWLAANVFDSTSGRRPAWAVPYRIVERGGLRIALVGYMRARTKQDVGAREGAGLVWRKGVAAIQDVLDAVRAAGPDLTIILAHEGGFCDSLPCQGEAMDLAGELDSTQVQLIVAAHTHVLINTVVNGITIMQARNNGTAYGIADLVRRADRSRGWRVRIETVWVDEVTPDSGIERILERNRSAVDQLASQPVALLRDSLPRDGTQYALGNLIADAQRAVAPGTDFAVMNNGGIRRELYAGPVTYSDLFELHPFGNNITRVRISGTTLKAVMERALQSGAPSFHISGFTVQYDPRRPPGERVLAMRRLDRTLIRPGRTYWLALSDFLQAGGEGQASLRTLPDTPTGKTDLDALIAYLKRQRQPVVAPAAPRFISVAP